MNYLSILRDGKKRLRFMTASALLQYFSLYFLLGEARLPLTTVNEDLKMLSPSGSKGSLDARSSYSLVHLRGRDC